jgi:periplasmic iron binding protein
MKKAKLFTLIAVLMVAALALAGCGGSKPADNKAGHTDTAKHEEKKDDKGAATDATFREYPIGEEQEAEGMTIAAVYLQPVEMEPVQKAGIKPTESDIHLEADISANKNNPLGFGEGEFVPYLTVKYALKNKDTGKETSGSFMPMNAGDGSHYGANVKMLGAGNYTLKFIIESPEKQDFLIHTDKATGVSGKFWIKPIEVSYDFSFVPRKW